MKLLLNLIIKSLCRTLFSVCSNAKEEKKKPYKHSSSIASPSSGEMGFTPWPYDLSEKAVNETYDFINSNATISAHHLDGCGPWN